MSNYTIDLKYIKNKQSFVMAVLACIYEEFKTIIKDNYGDRNRVLSPLQSLTYTYRNIFEAETNPMDCFGRYDSLETLEIATSFLMVQQYADKITDILKNQHPIKISIVTGGSYEDYVKILPNFNGYIQFKKA